MDPSFGWDRLSGKILKIPVEAGLLSLCNEVIGSAAPARRVAFFAECAGAVGDREVTAERVAGGGVPAAPERAA
jgi:hypothetical protein